MVLLIFYIITLEGKEIETRNNNSSKVLRKKKKKRISSLIYHENYKRKSYII